MSANFLLLIAVFLPPSALDELGLVVEERTIHTPYGDVGPLALRQRADQGSLWVQPYSGLPSRTDPRATLYAARLLGVQRVITWDAGVALNHLLQRGHSVIATDAIDWTSHQPDTFFHEPTVQLPPESHDIAPVFCPQLTSSLHECLPSAPPAVVVGVDGPRRETPAEARMYRTWGGDVICQNVTPEAFLAQELGLCFAAMLTITEYSRDQLKEPLEGEVRHGLEAVMRILPALLNARNEPRTCLCGA